MKDLFNYGQMLGMTDHMSDDEINDEISLFEKECKAISGSLEQVKSRKDSLLSSLYLLRQVRDERKHQQCKKDFVLTDKHLRLLANLDFKEFDNGSVFIGVEGKRPFGSSNIECDVADICGLDIHDDSNEIAKLLYELPFALNHVIKSYKI